LSHLKSDKLLARCARWTRTRRRNPRLL